MDDSKVRLINAYKALTNIKGQCSSRLNEQCHIHQLTFTQVEYLKVINKHKYITISDLAIEVDNSKPTVTEMVKKFINYDCVIKEKCEADGRKSYLRLTPRGEKIAQVEEHTVTQVVDYIIERLNTDELILLTNLLEKISQNPN